jgi:hypothetical protein
MITARDLIKALSNLPPNTPIVISSDQEGNSYGILGKYEIDLNGNLILYPSSSVEVEYD